MRSAPGAVATSVAPSCPPYIRLICRTLRNFNKPLRPFLSQPHYALAVNSRLPKQPCRLIVNAMAARRRQLTPDCLVNESSPIQYVTENGFSIIRLCDIDKSIAAGGTKHSFVVRVPQGSELQITVDISDSAVAEIVSRSRWRLSLNSSYWICCAERHLADYLWEHDDYPPEAKLKVEVLTLDDLNLARRWGN